MSRSPSKASDLLLEPFRAAGVGHSTPLWSLRAVGALSDTERAALIKAQVSTLAQISDFSPRTKSAVLNAAKGIDMTKLETAVLQLLCAKDAQFNGRAVAAAADAERAAFRYAATALRMAESVLGRFVDDEVAVAAARGIRLQPDRVEPSLDRFPSSMPPKDEQNTLLADCFELQTDRRQLRGETSSQFERYQDGLVLVLDAERFGSTKTLWHRRLELEIGGLDRFVVPNPFDFKRLALHLTLLADNESPAWLHIRLIECSSHALITERLDFTAGPVFRCVYLDYLGTWGGRRSGPKKKRCDPASEIRALFSHRRFFDGAILALTLTRGHGQKGHKGYNVAPTVTNYVYTTALQHSYRAVRQQMLEYQSSSPMVLLIFVIWVTGEPPPLVLGGHRGVVAGIPVAAAAAPAGRNHDDMGHWYQLPGVTGLSRCIAQQGGGWRTFFNPTLQQSIVRQYRRELLARYLVVPPGIDIYELSPGAGLPRTRVRLVGQSGGGWKHFVRENDPAGTVPFKIQISKSALEAAKVA